MIAAHTRRCRVVAGVHFRQPALLAKMVTTLNVLSGGLELREEGRDYDAIEKTGIFPFAVGEDGSGMAELIDELRRLAGAGIQTAIGIVPGSDPPRQGESIGERSFRLSATCKPRERVSCHL